MPSEIAREAAQAVEYELSDRRLGWDGIEEDLQEEVREAVAAIIDATIAAHEAAKWVSVEDRLPKVRSHGWSDAALVLADYRDQGGSYVVRSIQRVGSEGWTGYESSPMAVTHWRPLPAPPETP